MSKLQIGYILSSAVKLCRKIHILLWNSTQRVKENRNVWQNSKFVQSFIKNTQINGVCADKEHALNFEYLIKFANLTAMPHTVSSWFMENQEDKEQ